MTKSARARNATLTVVRTVWIMVVLALALGMVGPVMAEVNGTNATVVSSSRMATISIANATDIRGGASTMINLTFLTQTMYWQGYYGDVFNKVQLSDGTNLFYEWDNPVPEGEVYATRNTSIDWSKVTCADYGTVMKEQQITGFGLERVNNTFSSSNTNSFSVGSIPISSGQCSYAAYLFNASGEAGTFEEVLLESENNIIYTSIVVNDGSAFDQSTADFEMIVAEDGTDEVPTTYYFYAEIH